MPRATSVIRYDHKELAALMVKDQGIKKGLWMIQANFGWSVSNVVDPTGEISGPSTLSILTSLGIQEAEEPTPFTVDAAEVWAEAKPAKAKKAKAKKASP